MIVFINFAPLNFAGGAERWMIDVASCVSRLEEVTLIDVHSSIADIYGMIVLKRKYISRLSDQDSLKIHKRISLVINMFIPFTREWNKIRLILSESRKVYIRYELLEILILLYFGGFKVFKKTIAGLHSPFIYPSPKSFLDILHNVVYSSYISRWFLSKIYKVHILNKLDEDLFIYKFHLNNIIKIPNYVKTEDYFVSLQKNDEDRTLNIVVVGELSMRKGVDVLIKIIHSSPEDFVFNIAGDGPMKNKIMKLIRMKKVNYHGYLKEDDLAQLYKDCDVLFMPSRAESLPLSCLEAMSYGLPIVSSSAVDMGLPSYIHRINRDGSIESYKKMLSAIHILKNKKLLNYQKNKILKYVKENYSSDIIVPLLLRQVFEINS